MQVVQLSRSGRGGDDVTEWSVGDRVCALLAGGGYADEVAVAASQLLPLPTGLSVTEASVLPEAACTVYFNLAIATPSRANWSARSFSAWPAWPLIQCQRT